MVDCIIVGSGMAAISAALTLKAQGKTFEMVGSDELSKKIALAEKISNYPAFCGGSGKELTALLKRQLAENDIAVKNARVVGVYAMGKTVGVQTSDDVLLEGRCAILATGVAAAKQIEGEERFLGRGVSYCATCDAALYKGKRVILIATSKEGENEAAILERFAEKLYYVPLYKGAAFEPKKDNTEIFVDGLLKIEGNLRVERAVFKGRTIDADGVFLSKESVPLSTVCGGLKTDGAHVVVDRAMRTNLPGIFAAGDCTGKPYQYAKAVGEGCVAAHSVTEYLAALV